MTLDQLKYFVTAAQYEHLARAAHVLHVTPSTISHAIAALENDLGQLLFIKRGKHVHLTDNGKAFAKKAADLLDHAQEIKESFVLDPSCIEGYFRLGGTHMLCERVLAPAWFETVGQYPNLDAEILSLISANVLKGVNDGTLDFGICFSPQPHPDLAFTNIHEGQLVPAVGRDHPTSQLAPKKALELLRRSPAIFPKAYQGIDVCERLPILAQYELTPQVKVLYDSYDTAAALLAGSSCWTIMPDWAIRCHSANITAVRVPSAWQAPYSIAVVRRRSSRNSKPLEILIQNARRALILQQGT